MEVALNADEIINGPTPGNHLQVISSATELLRVIFFHLPSQKTWVVNYPITSLWGRGTQKLKYLSSQIRSAVLIKPSPDLNI